MIIKTQLRNKLLLFHACKIKCKEQTNNTKKMPENIFFTDHGCVCVCVRKKKNNKQGVT